MKKLLTGALASLVICLAAFSGCSKGGSSDSKIIIKGSTTVLPVAQKAVEAYSKSNTSVSISISGGGSGNGIKALIDGSTDIANSSREMKDEEIKLAEAKGTQIKEITVAYDMIVPVVHPSNTVNSITIDQLKAIYDGSITNWKALGGNDSAIIVISRDTSSGTYEVWHEMVMKKADVKKDALLQASNGAIVSTVSQNPKAIGYIGFGYMHQAVKPLKVNGVEGTIENGKSGAYPISRKLHMYINAKKPKEQTLRFIDFILSPEGQALVKEAGFIPL